MTERRLDPLTGQWRTFATHRQDRTFLPPASECPLCPTLPGGVETEIAEPAYDIVVFDNRFPSFSADPPPPSVPDTELYPVAPAAGAAEVVVYSDRHDQTFADLSRDRIRCLIDVWADRYRDLGARPEVDYVFIFENKGEVVGVTLSHPHGQIYGYPEIPPIPKLELDAATVHLEAHGSCVVCDIIGRERIDETRVIAANDSFLAFVPFAARFAYEAHVTATRHVTSIGDLTPVERDDLTDMLRRVTRGYDALFGFSLPYVMAMHQSPTDGGDWEAVSHFHIEFTPVHRSESKLKYLAGSELAAGAFVTDTSPETTAAQLRRAGSAMA